MTQNKDREGHDEGSHACCNKRLKEEGGKAMCCTCVPHDECDFTPTHPTSEPQQQPEERTAMNIVYQIGDALSEHLPKEMQSSFVDARQATNDKCIDFVFHLLQQRDAQWTTALNHIVDDHAGKTPQEAIEAVIASLTNSKKG